MGFPLDLFKLLIVIDDTLRQSIFNIALGQLSNDAPRMLSNET